MSGDARYLFGHFVHIRIRSVVYHRISEHQIDIPLVLEGAGNLTISYSPFDRPQVYGSSNDLIIIRHICNLHWASEDAPVSKVTYLVMEERYDFLKYSWWALLCRR